MEVDDGQSLSGADGTDGTIDSASHDVIVQLYYEESRWLTRYFYRNSISAAEADELTQETFVRFIRSGAVKVLTTPQAYLRRIAINLLRDRADLSATRIDNRKSPLSDADDIPAPFDPLRILTARQDIALCERLLEELDPFDRELFLLNRVEGYSFREIGRRKGLNEWAVKRKIFKVLDHLLDGMEGQ